MTGRSAVRWAPGPRNGDDTPTQLHLTMTKRPLDAEQDLKCCPRAKVGDRRDKTVKSHQGAGLEHPSLKAPGRFRLGS